MTAHRILAEIFEAPDCAGEPDAYDAWCAEADAAELVAHIWADVDRGQACQFGDGTWRGAAENEPSATDSGGAVSTRHR